MQGGAKREETDVWGRRVKAEKAAGWVSGLLVAATKEHGAHACQNERG